MCRIKKHICSYAINTYILEGAASETEMDLKLQQFLTRNVSCTKKAVKFSANIVS